MLPLCAINTQQVGTPVNSFLVKGGFIICVQTVVLNVILNMLVAISDVKSL